MSGRGEAIAYGAVTIVNALATGKGAAFGIDLWTKATVELTHDAKIETNILNDKGENTLLVEKCVRAILTRFDTQRLGAIVQTESNIPIARGLKSSSVAGNAVTLATLAALGVRMSPDEVLNVVVDAALRAKVSVTGAFDDASASLYGNVVVTDNMTRALLRTYPIEKYCVLLLVPPEKRYTIEVDLTRIKTVASQVETAFKEALAGHYWDAMARNGLIYSQVLGLPSDVILESLEAGAQAAGISGKGPAYAFVVKEELKESVLTVLRRHEGEIIVSKTRGHPSISTLEKRGFTAIEDCSKAQ